MRLDRFLQDTMQVSGRAQAIANEAAGGPLELDRVMENLAEREVYALQWRGTHSPIEFTVQRIGLESKILGGRIRIELTRAPSVHRRLLIAAIILAAIFLVGGVAGGLQLAYQAGQRSVVTNVQLPTE